jgi:hypothetical protein
VRTAEEESACRGQPKHDLSWLAGAWANERKKTTRAAEANPGERAAFQEEQQTLPIEGLVFIDEIAGNIAMTRLRARAPNGERAAMND